MGCIPYKFWGTPSRFFYWFFYLYQIIFWGSYTKLFLMRCTPDNIFMQLHGYIFNVIPDNVLWKLLKFIWDAFHINFGQLHEGWIYSYWGQTPYVLGSSIQIFITGVHLRYCFESAPCRYLYWGAPQILFWVRYMKIFSRGAPQIMFQGSYMKIFYRGVPR